MNKRTGFVYAVLVAALLTAIPMRTLLLLNDIDPKTGFYTKSSTLVPILTVVLIAATILMLLPLFWGSYKDRHAQPRRSQLTGVLSSLLVALFFIDGLHEFYLLISRTGSIGDFLTAICEFAATAFFAMLATSCFKGDKMVYPIASLLPVVWATVHLMAAFMHYTSVINVSEYLFDMLKLVFVMLFFYYHARYTGGVSNGREIRGMLAFGLPAVFYSLLSTLPRYIAAILGRAVTLNPSEDLLFIALAVYILCTIVRLFAKPETADAGTEQPASES